MNTHLNVESRIIIQCGSSAVALPHSCMSSLVSVYHGQDVTISSTYNPGVRYLLQVGCVEGENKGSNWDFSYKD
jgi:hypothetical protein